MRASVYELLDPLDGVRCHVQLLLYVNQVLGFQCLCRQLRLKISDITIVLGAILFDSRLSCVETLLQTVQLCFRRASSKPPASSLPPPQQQEMGIDKT